MEKQERKEINRERKTEISEWRNNKGRIFMEKQKRKKVNGETKTEINEGRNKNIV